MSSPDSQPSLSLDDFASANRRAQIDGVVAGSAGGFLSWFLAQRAFKLPKNQALISGMAAGVGVGYFFASAALKANLLKHQASSEALRKALKEIEEGPKNGGEGGVAGMEAFHDKYASTRGDH